MAFGSTTPPGAAPSTSTPAAGSTAAPALNEQQVKAISMLLSQMGKGAPVTTGNVGGQPRSTGLTNTVQGGTYFNPQATR